MGCSRKMREPRAEYGENMQQAADDLLVSCLMVTKPVAVRFAMLERSIDCYCRQSHRNRELIILVDAVRDSEANRIKSLVARLSRDDITVSLPPEKMSLGALRNLSWRHARGEVVCQWDDDDLSHPSRIAVQLSALLGSARPACFLQEFMQYFPSDARLYKLNFVASPDGVAPNTLMCLRKLQVKYPESGPDSIRGEDTALIPQIRNLGGYLALAGVPHLYVYVSHGANTFGDAHHRMLAERLAVSKGLLMRNEADLRAGLAAFDFETRDVILMGRNGEAFNLLP